MQVSLSLACRGLFLYTSYVLWSAALDSFDLLQSYYITSLAQYLTTMLMLPSSKHINIYIYYSESGCPPVLINAKGVKAGSCSISGQISSQYLSALLMMGPLAQGEVQLKIKDELMSAPYVMMTMNLMRKFGAHSTSEEGDLLFRVQGNKDKDAKHDKEGDSKGYKSPGTFFIEGDASSASYFLAGAAITGGTVTVHGCGSESVQVSPDLGLGAITLYRWCLVSCGVVH